MIKTNFKLLSAFLIFLLSFQITLAQQGTVSSGGEIIGDNGYMSFTVGQMDFISVDGSKEIISQGIQQHVEVIPVRGIEGLKDGELKLTIYPNPAEEFITIAVESTNLEHLSCALFNTEGKQVNYQLLNGQGTVISLKHLPAATYIVKIMTEGIEFKEYKIIKN